MHAATFRALGEPSRLRIVELLRAGPLSVGEIVDHLGIRQPQVSKHLRVLGESGIVTAEAHARQRIYHLDALPFAAIQDWVASFERTWDERLDRLGAFLEDTDDQTGAI
jgi:DNA-binding transcriptional ArsR family regulator